MPENTVPAPTTRPRRRLLSDILESPHSESAIPAEYTSYRASWPAPPSKHRPEGLENLKLPHADIGSQQPPRSVKAPTTSVAHDPGIIGQLPNRGSSSSLFSQSDRLQPLTPINPQCSSRSSEKSRSTPKPHPIFTTSPAVSEQGSPSQAHFAPLDRSSSQTSLNSHHNLSRPRTPTPSIAGLKGKGRSATRSSSVPGSPGSHRATPHPYGKPSVKHLTCFWWKVKGDCRFAEEDCLYAHHDTGLLADAPRQVTPGEPAKAGRHLEKALENLRSKRNLSAAFISTSMAGTPSPAGNPTPPDNQCTSCQATTPVDREILQDRLSYLQTDNNFLRNLVDQSSKEKSILMTTIEGLQKENTNLSEDVEYLKDRVYELQREHRRLSGAMQASKDSPEGKYDL